LFIKVLLIRVAGAAAAALFINFFRSVLLFVVVTIFVTITTREKGFDPLFLECRLFLQALEVEFTHSQWHISVKWTVLHSIEGTIVCVRGTCEGLWWGLKTDCKYWNTRNTRNIEIQIFSIPPTWYHTIPLAWPGTGLVPG
jgi:hypothetical protein